MKPFIPLERDVAYHNNYDPTTHLALRVIKLEGLVKTLVESVGSSGAITEEQYNSIIDRLDALEAMSTKVYEVEE